MTWVQEAPPIPKPSLDPLDVLVPPMRSGRRSLATAALVVGVLAISVAVFDSGLVRPRLGLEEESTFSWTQASGQTMPELQYIVSNNGIVPLTIDSVDAGVPGLGQPQVRVERYGPPASEDPPAASLVTPFRLGAGQQVQVNMRYASWNCRGIDIHGSDTVPFHVRGPLGFNTTASVIPGYHFDPPGTPVLVGLSDANQIGWAAAITWKACHPGSESAGAGSP